jgi:hypothetical protein
MTCSCYQFWTTSSLPEISGLSLPLRDFETRSVADVGQFCGQRPSLDAGSAATRRRSAPSPIPKIPIVSEIPRTADSEVNGSNGADGHFFTH